MLRVSGGWTTALRKRLSRGRRPCRCKQSEAPTRSPEDPLLFGICTGDSIFERTIHVKPQGVLVVPNGVVVLAQDNRILKSVLVGNMVFRFPTYGFWVSGSAKRQSSPSYCRTRNLHTHNCRYMVRTRSRAEIRSAHCSNSTEAPGEDKV